MQNLKSNIDHYMELKGIRMYSHLLVDIAHELGIKGQEAYKFADLENVITSLSGLYVLLMNIFAKIKNNREDSPIPNSKLFNMKSKRWSKCKYFNTIYASISDNGNIYFDNTINYLMY